jgi:phosphoserine phosphatase
MMFRFMTARYSPIRVTFALLERVTGRQFLKHLVVRLLTGTPVEQLEESASEYAGWLLQERRIPQVWEVLSERQQSDCIILASASLEPVVRQLAIRMEVRYVASALEDRDGVLTGRYALDITGNKEQACRKKYKVTRNSVPKLVISDNLSDRPLLEKAAEAYVVLHRPSHRQRWAGLQAVFITVR